MEKKELYEKKGQAAGAAVSSIITLVIGMAVIVLLIIFVGALAGQTFELVESDIDDITNTTVKNHVKTAIISGFSTLEQTANYMPLIILAVIIFIVLALVLGFTALGGGNQMGGSL
jgi:hypothetical protein